MNDSGRDLSQLLDLLRSKGVVAFSGALDGKPISVTFEAARPMLPMPTELGAEPEAEVCACGHDAIGAHNHLGCLQGCSPEECDPESRAAPKKKARKK